MLCVVSCLCLFLLLSLTTVCMVNSENEATAKITEAENALNSAYEAVLQAEKAGANVTDLLSNLTEAAELLSKAKLVLSTNESAAVDFAVESQAKLNGFSAKADALAVAGAQQRYWDFMVNIEGSVAVVCGGLIVWTVLKKKYEKTGSEV